MVQVSSRKTILITGATGKQGGAVLRHLIGSTLEGYLRKAKRGRAQVRSSVEG
jgi:uncharacterized protein YbjT (DUF2867 family)